MLNDARSTFDFDFWVYEIFEYMLVMMLLLLFMNIPCPEYLMIMLVLLLADDAWC